MMIGDICIANSILKPIFHLATLFARREAKTRIWQRDWLKLAGEEIRCKQVGTVPTFLSVRANKFANWKIGFRKHKYRQVLKGVLYRLEKDYVEEGL